MEQMKVHIQAELAELARQEHIHIVYACESGSRAWGFPSTDSDYDVRFIYVRPLEWYLSITDKRDVVERPINQLLDMSGWDLRKALQLLTKSNPPLLEWLQSSIVYVEQSDVSNELRTLANRLFSPKACMYHYLSMARGNYRTYLQQEQVRMKKYFYVLRPLLACMWIEQHRSIPPLSFQQLVEAFIPEHSPLAEAITTLLAQKMQGLESDFEPRIEVLNEFIERQLDYYTQVATQMEAGQPVSISQVDTLFQQIVLHKGVNQNGLPND